MNSAQDPLQGQNKQGTGGNASLGACSFSFFFPSLKPSHGRMNRQVHEALRHAVQLSLTLSACVYQSVCLSMISLPQTMSLFIFYQMPLKLCSNARSKGDLLRPCVPLYLCHCLLLCMRMDPTRRDTRVVTHTPGLKQTFQYLD